MATAVLWIASLALVATLAAAAVAARLARELREARERLLADAEARTQVKGLLAASEGTHAELAAARAAREELRAEVARREEAASALSREVDRLGREVEQARAAEATAAARQRELTDELSATTRAAEKTAAALREKADATAAALREKADESAAALRETADQAAADRLATSGRLARAEAEARSGNDQAERLQKDLVEAHRRLGAAQAETTQLSTALLRAEGSVGAAKTAGDAFAAEARALREEIRGLKARLAEAEGKPGGAGPPGAGTESPSIEPPPRAAKARSTANAPAVSQAIRTWTCQRCGQRGSGTQQQPCCAGWKGPAGSPK